MGDLNRLVDDRRVVLWSQVDGKSIARDVYVGHMTRFVENEDIEKDE